MIPKNPQKTWSVEAQALLELILKNNQLHVVSSSLASLSIYHQAEIWTP